MANQNREPAITINGQVCTDAEAMTIRTAIEHFSSCLHEKGLGEDAIGKAICEGYLQQIESIRKRIFR